MTHVVTGRIVPPQKKKTKSVGVDRGQSWRGYAFAPSTRAARAFGASTGERHGIQSVDRAITLLETIAEAGGEATLTDIATRAEAQYLDQPSPALDTGAARLRRQGGGAPLLCARRRILELGYASLREIELPQRAERFIDRLNETTGETVHLVALHGDTMMHLAKREAPGARARVRSTRPDGAHAKASGKAILAWLPEYEALRVTTAQGMIEFTPTRSPNGPR